MTQEAVQITTTPPLPGLQLVQDMNKALETIATDFAGSSDPAATAWPYSTWADSSTGTLKRRNDTNSAWVIEGRLLRAHLPMYALADVPTLDIGPIYIIGKGPAEWVVSEYKVLMPDFPTDSDLQWLGTPVGGYITPLTPPPTDDPRFRYALCTAGEDGPGGYNEGVLTGETVTGSSPKIVATAVVSLAGAPMDGQTIRLINTTREFFRPGTPTDTPQESQNAAHVHPQHPSTPLLVVGASFAYTSGVGNRDIGGNTQSSGGDEARPRNFPHVYYRRIK
jgi:hypothetical protein